MLKNRAKLAGVPPIHAHQFRHTYANFALAAGMQETDLMNVAGWRSRAMLSRYGASAAAQRELAAQQKLKLGNRW